MNLVSHATSAWSSVFRRRPLVSMHIDEGMLTITNSGRCPAEVTDLAIVPVLRSGAPRRFGAGTVMADLGGTTVAVRGPVTLDGGDSIQAMIHETMIDRPHDPDGSFDVHGCAIVTGRASAQFSNIASFRTFARQQPRGPETAERELRARLMWGFS